MNEYFGNIAFHPSEILEEKLNELNLSIKEFSNQSGVCENTIIQFLKKEIDITPDIAEKFEQTLKIPAYLWLLKQKNYNEFLNS
jgi:plasmid maintenance system antidote protein VapI